MTEIRFRNPVKQVGFAQILHIITMDPELSDGAFRTYALYLMYAQQKDLAWPGRVTVANIRDKTDTTISNHNQELERLGYITRKRRMGKTSITWIEDIEQMSKFQETAVNVLECRDNLTTNIKLTCRSTSSEIAAEEEQGRRITEEEQLSGQKTGRDEEQNARADSTEPDASTDRDSDTGGGRPEGDQHQHPVEPDSVTGTAGPDGESEGVGESIDAGKLLAGLYGSGRNRGGEREPASALETVLQEAFGFRGKRMAQGKAKSLRRVVEMGDPDNPGRLRVLPSPIDLYESEPDFPDYVSEGIEWASDPNSFNKPINGSGMRNACIGWIRNYSRGWNGWLAFKERGLDGSKTEGADKSERVPTTEAQESEGYAEQLARFAAGG